MKQEKGCQRDLQGFVTPVLYLLAPRPVQSQSQQVGREEKEKVVMAW